MYFHIDIKRKVWNFCSRYEYNKIHQDFLKKYQCIWQWSRRGKTGNFYDYSSMHHSNSLPYNADVQLTGLNKLLCLVARWAGFSSNGFIFEKDHWWFCKKPIVLFCLFEYWLFLWYWYGNYFIPTILLRFFQTDIRLCLSISDYHPDTWNPAWSVSTILTG